jgi:hypothetical protein
MADCNGIRGPGGASCADCGAPALDRFDCSDDLSVSVWLCLRCVRARFTDLGRWRHVDGVER